MAKFIRWHVLFFFLIKTRSGLRTRIEGSACRSKNFMRFIFQYRFWFVHLLTWPNFSLLHNSQWIDIPTQGWYAIKHNQTKSIIHKMCN